MLKHATTQFSLMVDVDYCLHYEEAYMLQLSDFTYQNGQSVDICEQAKHTRTEGFFVRNEHCKARGFISRCQFYSEESPDKKNALYSAASIYTR